MNIGDDFGYVVYNMKGKEVILSHTFIPQGSRGSGFGSMMVKQCLDSFVKQGYQIIPTCNFIHHFIDENPQYHQSVSRWIA